MMRYRVGRVTTIGYFQLQTQPAMLILHGQLFNNLAGHLTLEILSQVAMRHEQGFFGR